MQHTDPWDIPAPSHGAPQPLIPRTPSPQTGDQAALAHENAIAAHDRNQHIDPDTLTMMAQRYVNDGTQPNFGMGNATDRRNFWEAVRHEAGALGLSGGDLAVRIRQFHNGTHALQTLENQLGTISGNEQSARGYAEQALSALRALDPGNSWAPTNWLRNIVGDTTNDPNLGTWDTARNTFLTEYGKVVAGSPSGAGVLSDSARQEQMAVLRRTTNPQQAAAIIAQMNRDMEIRLHALQANIQRGYENLRAGHTISFNPQGEALDERGNIVPVAGIAGGRDDQTPPVIGHPGRPSGGAPPGAPPGSAPAGERMDHTTVNQGAPGDVARLNTAAMERVPDPALAGLNEHINAMMQPGPHQASDAEVRQYIQDRGIPLNQIPGLNAALAWRAAHPNYAGAYGVDLDKHLVPVSTFRNMMTNVGDTGTGAAVIAAGNMATGQQLANIVGATGGDAEMARFGINEIRNRHPVGAVVGDIGGAAMTYGGAQALGRVGLNTAERLAPSVFARLPAWVRAGTTAGEAEAAAAPFSGEAASQATLAPTATLAPRAIATDAGIGAYESPGNRVEGALVSAGTGGASRGTLNTAARAVSPTGGNLAPAYEEGVVPTVGQRMGGVGNRMEQAFQSIPILGGIQRSARTAAQDQWQLGGFNRALRNLPDEPQLPAGTAPGTAPHAFSQKAFDDAYARVHQRISVVPDDQLQQDLDTIRQEATTTLPDQSLSHFNRVLDNAVIPRLSREGPLSGSDLQDMLSRVRRAARNIRSTLGGDMELADHFDDVSQSVYDNAARHSAPEAMATLNNINRGYGMLARVETAANRAGAGDPGEYTAKALLDAERRQGGLRGRQYLAGNGLMTDYARAGKLLGQTVPDSGSIERAATVGGIGALTHFVSPYAAAPLIADTLATLPGARNAVNWALKPNNATFRAYTDILRAQIQQRAGIGSTIGLPAVVAAYQGQP